MAVEVCCGGWGSNCLWNTSMRKAVVIRRWTVTVTRQVRQNNLLPHSNSTRLRRWQLNSPQPSPSQEKQALGLNLVSLLHIPSCFFDCVSVLGPFVSQKTKPASATRGFSTQPPGSVLLTLWPVPPLQHLKLLAASGRRPGWGQGHRATGVQKDVDSGILTDHWFLPDPLWGTQLQDQQLPPRPSQSGLEADIGNKSTAQSTIVLGCIERSFQAWVRERCLGQETSDPSLQSGPAKQSQVQSGMQPENYQEFMEWFCGEGMEDRPGKAEVASI